ncbi:MAG: carcinine hydrolase/isopenicillin-N N-acyltransferase family protein [Bacillota bacterium]|nr:carcinine hydrolase/isopenicillin-N N-acyltransferase family protein [Bacillota bacterium]
MWRYHRNYFQTNVSVLEDAFGKDSYNISKIINESNRLAIMAEHKTAVNYDTGQPKRAYYLEGNSYDTGYLLGLLAEKEISSMAVEFADKIIFDFIRNRDETRGNIFMDIFIPLVNSLTKGMYNELPQEIRDEIRGLYDGCRKSDKNTKVTMERLIALNFDMDVLCSLVYTGAFIFKKISKVTPADFKIPLACNGFSVFGKNALGGHYFGRDFMFPNAGVFHKTATHIIYNLRTDKGNLPFVSITAPGIAGSISAMNINGIAIGVNMSPSANCNTRQVGMNSLLLARTGIQKSRSAEEVVELMENTTRGVSWNYIVADGLNDKACVVEAGASGSSQAFTQFPPAGLKHTLPDMAFIKAHKSAEYRKGLMVRWNDYKYPEEYLAFNSGLWRNAGRLSDVRSEIYPDAFGEMGYINKIHTERNCPSMHYFAPQREKSDNIIIAANHYIIPEMRFYSMYPWTSMIVGNIVNDMQWRYDELNNQILTEIRQSGYIDFNKTKRIIDFLAPYGKYPLYYSKSPKSKDGKEIQIRGCTSVFDLKRKRVESHFGYYCDDWVSITLPNYFIN